MLCDSQDVVRDKLNHRFPSRVPCEEVILN